MEVSINTAVKAKYINNTKSVDSINPQGIKEAKPFILILLQRYYGDNACTKSHFFVLRMCGTDSAVETLLAFEAREPRYADYEMTFKGASGYCLPCGNWKLKVEATPYGPMGLKLPKCAGHRQVYIGWSDTKQWKQGEIMIGEPSVDICKNMKSFTENMKENTIHSGKQVYEQLEEIVYEAFGRGEEIVLSVTNEGIADHRDNNRQNGRWTII